MYLNYRGITTIEFILVIEFIEQRDLSYTGKSFLLPKTRLNADL